MNKSHSQDQISSFGFENGLEAPQAAPLERPLTVA
jgi:hypothetical protein